MTVIYILRGKSIQFIIICNKSGYNVLYIFTPTLLLSCRVCYAVVCVFDQICKSQIFSAFSHTQITSSCRPSDVQYPTNIWGQCFLHLTECLRDWSMFCLPFRERPGASPGLQRCGWRSEVCQLPVKTARHASVLLLAPSLRYSPVSSVSFAKGVSFAKFKTPAVMTGHRGKYQNSPNQKCSFRPTTVKIYTSDFLHWQDWKSSNSILSALHVGCSVDSVRKLNLKSEFNWAEEICSCKQ